MPVVAMGVAAASVPEYSGSDKQDETAIPLIVLNYNNKWYWNINRGGVWLLDNADESLRLGLAAKILEKKLDAIDSNWIPQIHWAARELGKAAGEIAVQLGSQDPVHQTAPAEGNRFAQIIDEFAVFDRALSPEEIAGLATAAPTAAGRNAACARMIEAARPSSSSLRYAAAGEEPPWLFEEGAEWVCVDEISILSVAMPVSFDAMALASFNTSGATPMLSATTMANVVAPWSSTKARA